MSTPPYLKTRPFADAGTQLFQRDAKWAVSVAVLVGLATLSACDATHKPVSTTAAMEAARPANAVLAQKYERSCMTCHLDVSSGAPRTGDPGAWKPRLALGPDALIHSVQQGKNAMPPLGLCPDCSREDLGALIDFMSQTGDKP